MSVISNQYIGSNSVPASDYFNMDELTDVTISGIATCINSSDMSYISALKQYNVKLRDITIELAYTHNEETDTFGKYIPSCIASRSSSRPCSFHRSAFAPLFPD